MFPVTPNPTFTVETVPVTLPGKAEPVTVGIEFKHRTAEELQEFQATFGEVPLHEAMHEVVVGWTGFSQPFSADALKQVCKAYPVVAKELWRTYLDELTTSKRKN